MGQSVHGAGAMASWKDLRETHSRWREQLVLRQAWVWSVWETERVQV